MSNLLLYVIVSSLNIFSRTVEYCIVLEEWIDRAAGTFQYPPDKEKNYILKYLKNNLPAQPYWPKFNLRKIHHDNIESLGLARALSKEVEKSNSTVDEFELTSPGKSESSISSHRSRSLSNDESDDGSRRFYSNNKYKSSSSNPKLSKSSSKPRPIQRHKRTPVKRTQHTPVKRSETNKRSKSVTTFNLDAETHSFEKNTQQADSRTKRTPVKHSETNKRSKSVTTFNLDAGTHSFEKNTQQAENRTNDDENDAASLNLNVRDTPDMNTIIVKKLDQLIEMVQARANSPNEPLITFLFDSALLPIRNLSEFQSMEKNLEIAKYKEQMIQFLSALNEDTVREMTYAVVNRVFSDKLVLMISFSTHPEKLTLKNHGPLLLSAIRSVVMWKFRKFKESRREKLRPDPRKIEEYISLRIKNFAYSVTKNPDKRKVVEEAQNELKSWNEMNRPHDVHENSDDPNLDEQSS